MGLWLNILSLLLLFMSRQISYSVLYMCNYIYYAFIIIVSYRTYVCCLWIIISSWYIYERTDILHLYTVIFFYISVINLRRNAMFMESWICVVYERNVGHSRRLPLIWGGNNIVRCAELFCDIYLMTCCLIWFY